MALFSAFFPARTQDAAKLPPVRMDLVCSSSSVPHAGNDGSEGGQLEGHRGMLAAAAAIELRVVRRAAALTRFRSLALATRVVNTLGNGWIYLPIALGVHVRGGPRAPGIFAAVTLSIVIAHVLYAAIKRGIARERPFRHDQRLQPVARPLDRYSFPSGHCMTLAAVALPIVQAMPPLWPLAVVALAVLGVCRLTAAHHYPSDVIGGTLMGAAIALAVCQWLPPTLRAAV